MTDPEADIVRPTIRFNVMTDLPQEERLLIRLHLSKADLEMLVDVVEQQIEQHGHTRRLAWLSFLLVTRMVEFDGRLEEQQEFDREWKREHPELPAEPDETEDQP